MKSQELPEGERLIDIDIAIVDDGLWQTPIDSLNDIVEYDVFGSLLPRLSMPHDLQSHADRCVAAIRWVYPNARLCVVRVGLEGEIVVDSITRAIRWLTNYRPRVISLSMGLHDGYRLGELASACSVARDAGITIVAAHANDGARNYPAGFHSVVGVAGNLTNIAQECELRNKTEHGYDVLVDGKDYWDMLDNNDTRPSNSQATPYWAAIVGRDQLGSIGVKPTEHIRFGTTGILRLPGDLWGSTIRSDANSTLLKLAKQFPQFLVGNMEVSHSGMVDEENHNAEAAPRIGAVLSVLTDGPAVTNCGAVLIHLYTNRSLETELAMVALGIRDCFSKQGLVTVITSPSEYVRAFGGLQYTIPPSRSNVSEILELVRWIDQDTTPDVIILVSHQNNAQWASVVNFSISINDESRTTSRIDGTAEQYFALQPIELSRCIAENLISRFGIKGEGCI